MFKTILLPTDGSPLSGKAIDAAVKFAKGSGSRIVALSVGEPHQSAHRLVEGSAAIDAEHYDRHMLEIAQAYVNQAAAVAKAAGVPCDTVVRQSTHPHEEIISVASEFQCDVIFMASHGRKGVSALILGSETHKVLAYSTLPVMVIR